MDFHSDLYALLFTRLSLYNLVSSFFLLLQSILDFIQHIHKYFLIPHKDLKTASLSAGSQALGSRCSELPEALQVEGPSQASQPRALPRSKKTLICCLDNGSVSSSRAGHKAEQTTHPRSSLQLSPLLSHTRLYCTHPRLMEHRFNVSTITSPLPRQNFYI